MDDGQPLTASQLALLRRAAKWHAWADRFSKVRVPVAFVLTTGGLTMLGRYPGLVKNGTVPPDHWPLLFWLIVFAAILVAPELCRSRADRLDECAEKFGQKQPADRPQHPAE
jgi:hypothetical protein